MLRAGQFEDAGAARVLADVKLDGDALWWALDEVLRLASQVVLIEAGRWLTYAACLKYRAREDAVKEISMVKLFTAEMAQKVAYECVQLHGGYGYMREFPVERFFRDVRLWTIASGTSEIMREIIAKRLLS